MLLHENEEFKRLKIIGYVRMRAVCIRKYPWINNQKGAHLN